eukprot:Rmarinus@m.15830
MSRGLALLRSLSALSAPAAASAATIAGVSLCHHEEHPFVANIPATLRVSVDHDHKTTCELVISIPSEGTCAPNVPVTISAGEGGVADVASGSSPDDVDGATPDVDVDVTVRDQVPSPSDEDLATMFKAWFAAAEGGQGETAASSEPEEPQNEFMQAIAEFFKENSVEAVSGSATGSIPAKETVAPSGPAGELENGNPLAALQAWFEQAQGGSASQTLTSSEPATPSPSQPAEATAAAETPSATTDAPATDKVDLVAAMASFFRQGSETHAPAAPSAKSTSSPSAAAATTTSSGASATSEGQGAAALPSEFAGLAAMFAAGKGAEDSSSSAAPAAPPAGPPRRRTYEENLRIAAIPEAAHTASGGEAMQQAVASFMSASGEGAVAKKEPKSELVPSKGGGFTLKIVHED